MLVKVDRFANLVLDPEYRVKTRHRVLKDDGYAGAPDLPHFGFGFVEQIFAIEVDRTADDFRIGLRRQPQDRHGRHRLAAARLADKTEALAGVQAETHPIDRLVEPAAAAQMRFEIPDLQQRHPVISPHFGARDLPQTSDVCRLFDFITLLAHA